MTAIARGATASALLLDVRNDYPYGTASATPAKNGFVPSFGSEQRREELANSAETGAVAKLTGEVDTMIVRLGAGL